MGEHVSNFTRSILPFVPQKKKEKKSILIGGNQNYSLTYVSSALDYKSFWENCKSNKRKSTNTWDNFFNSKNLKN
jgi:hypothetical protein